MTDLVRGPDGNRRCWWSTGDPDYTTYHDEEWGAPLHGDAELYERICLEAFQSGLSWLTILRKRENFRRAFDGFDPARVATYRAKDVNRLLNDTGIVRNRAKIEATITNARATLAVDEGLDALIWSFAPTRRRAAPKSRADIPAITPESTALAKELKRRGFVFFGPTTAYALMQACGLVDDHLARCWRRGLSSR